MLFGINNVGPTFKSLMNMVFPYKIGYNFKVYIHDMMVDIPEEKSYCSNLK